MCIGIMYERYKESIRVMLLGFKRFEEEER